MKYQIQVLFVASMLSLPLAAQAEDPLLTEEFFESPATKDNEEDSSFGQEEPGYILPPPPVEQPQQQSQPRGPLFERHSISGGIGISSGYFAIRGTVRSHFNEYFVLENTAFYRREVGEQSSKDYSLEFYGLDSAVVAQYQIIKLLTPFVGGGPGFEMWSQLYDEFEFDKGNSVNAIAFVGTNINMTKNLILQLRHVTKFYLTDQPIKLSDRSTKEDSTLSYFQVYFLIAL